MSSAFEEAFKKAQASSAAKGEEKSNPTVEQQAQASVGTAPPPANNAWLQAMAGVTPIAHSEEPVHHGAMDPEAQEAAALRRALGVEPLSADALPPKNKPQSPRAKKPKRVAHTMGPQTIPARYRDAWEGVRAPVFSAPRYSTPRYPHLQAARPKPTPAADEVRLTLDPSATVTWTGRQTERAAVTSGSHELGRRDQVYEGQATGTREVVLGFDFGTSSSKVVIGDRGLKQAFAVPFCDAVGIDIFLLPSRLYFKEGRFSLQDTGCALVLNDLKLALMADPDDTDLQSRIVAYLALAIRHARGWLFQEHAQSYAQTQLVWTLALGLPADQTTSGMLTELFRRLALAAWHVAGGASELTPADIAQSLTQSPKDDVEIVVMPEIAAQIYGFVSSRSFDPNARNIFLLADVGAGTVDASLFRVVPGRGGRWSFEVYTAAVEPNGVMNLHRERLSWWQQQLEQSPIASDLPQRLKGDLEALKLPTEFQGRVPEQFTGYMKGVTAEFSGKATGPDKQFFQSRLVKQVQGRTLYRAFSAGVLSQVDLGDVPFFLCGGGSRLAFYQDLPDALTHLNSYTWLGARHRQLAIPNDLRADGLPNADFDRLSVAYGLSMLNLSSVDQAKKLPQLAPQSSDGWRNHYVDKDQI